MGNPGVCLRVGTRLNVAADGGDGDDGRGMLLMMMVIKMKLVSKYFIGGPLGL